MKATERIHPHVARAMREHIAECDGQEVLFVCKADKGGRLCEIDVAARGNRESVPAPAPHVERGDVVVHNHPGGRLRPSDADIHVAAGLGAQGIGFYIVDNNVESVYAVVEPVLIQETEPVDPMKLSAVLSDGGALSRSHTGFEARESQIDMLSFVVRAFNESKIAVAEAGTGVGKSYAYLIPALAWTAQNDERVVISTATINLQQQLIEKDIPVVAKLLRTDVKAALVKGRGNYLCRNRLEEALEEDTLFDETSEELVALKEWAETTKTGSRSEAPFFPSDAIWSRVNSDPDSCSGLRCRNRNDCFLRRARREAASARILVVNHHLLFSDLSLRLRGLGFENTAILPPFQRLIFDEAHNIEKSATSYFSESFSRFSLGKYLARLFRTRRGKNLGLLLGLQRVSGPHHNYETIPGQIVEVREQAELLNERAAAVLESGGQLRLTDPPGDAVEEEVLAPMQELQSRLLSLIDAVAQIVRGIPEEQREEAEVYDVRMVLRRLEAISAMCESFRNFADSPERVFYLERRRAADGRPLVRYVATPVDVSDVMAEAVYEPYPTVIFTSATLTVDNSFAFWTGRVGLDPEDSERVRCSAFPSPFDYRTRVLLGVPADAGTPDSEGFQDFLNAFVREALSISEGKALVLFTSYDMLSRTYEAVRPRLAELGITAFRQGDDERSRLLARFNTDTASVLFATDSFWEGIDAPGETLQLVILCKLPFRVPTDPVLVARTEAIRAGGGNPFAELALPEAVMRLKQGFGRLMRRRDDRGAVLIADSRIVHKGYGKVFLSSLPETRTSLKEAALVLEDLERFLYSG